MLQEHLRQWDDIFCTKAEELYPVSDPSHDTLHIARVVKMALHLADEEGADMNVVLPAAYFHDFVNVPKSDPRRRYASRLSAEAAAEYLASVGYPYQYIGAVKHAITAHSFSANIKPETIEAKVVQDADRLDSLGAIGIARCITTSTLMQRPYYFWEYPFAADRAYDDQRFAIDHFHVKLFKIAETMQTETGKREAGVRAAFMRQYLDQFVAEISP
jgi:uncharacterized protein